MVLVLVLVIVAACVRPELVDCGEWSCPAGFVCVEVSRSCALPADVAACDGLAEGDACGMAGGTCHGGVCSESRCGNGAIDIGESCDDGNNADGDGCASNCRSDERCGNTIVDPVRGEECDDGNAVEHDGCSSACAKERPSWALASLAAPVEMSPMAVLDPSRAVVVDVSIDAAVPLSPTERALGLWRASPTALTPSPRSGFAIAYAGHGRTVIAGGGFGIFPNQDAWMWDGKTWTRIADLPGVRQQSIAAYDPVRERVLVINGNVGGQIFFGSPDSAELDVASGTWTNIGSAGPVGREGGAIAWVPELGALVFVGGYDVDLATDARTYATDVWLYDGTWTRVANANAPKRAFAYVAYSRALHALVEYGGQDETNVYKTDTFAFDATARTWSRLPLIGPPPRTDAALVDLGEATGQLALYGGRSTITGTLDASEWRFDARGWTSASVGPSASLAGPAVWSPRRGASYAPCKDLSDHWTVCTVDERGVTRAPPDPATDGQRDGPIALGYDEARDRVVWFAQDTGETFTWDGAAWTHEHPANRPPAVQSFTGSIAMPFDRLHGGVVLVTSGVWLWNGSDWVTEQEGGGISGKVSPSLAWDPSANVLVQYGGYTPLIPDAPADKALYTFDGTTWKRVAETAESPVLGGQLVWNPARQRMQYVVVGQFGGAWELDTPTATWTRLGVPGTLDGYGGGIITSSHDGSGVMVLDVSDANGNPTPNVLQMAFRAEDAPGEVCRSDDAAPTDHDGDGLVGCADPDCWPVCSPTCELCTAN